MVWAIPESVREQISQPGIAIRYYVKLYARSMLTSSEVVFEWVSGNSAFTDPTGIIPNSVSSISPVGAEIDPITRVFTRDDISLVLTDDGSLRDAFRTNWCIGKKLEVFIGVEGDNTLDLVRVGTYVTSGVIPTEGSLTLIASDASKLWEDASIVGTFNSWHPLEVIRIALEDGLFPQDLWDSAAYGSLNPTQQDRDGTDYKTTTPLSHYLLTRANHAFPHTASGQTFQNLLSEPTPIFDIINAMCFMMYGSFLPGQDGKYRYKHFSKNAAPAYTWTSDDIGEFNQTSSWELQYNRFLYKFCKRGGEYIYNLAVNDTNSQSAYAYGGSGSVDKRILEFSTNMDWLCPASDLTSSHAGAAIADIGSRALASDTIGSTYRLEHAQLNGFCGTALHGGFDYAPGTGTSGLRTGCDVTSGRPAYHSFTQVGVPGAEIIKTEAVDTAQGAAVDWPRQPGFSEVDCARDPKWPLPMQYNIAGVPAPVTARLPSTRPTELGGDPVSNAWPKDSGHGPWWFWPWHPFSFIVKERGALHSTPRRWPKPGGTKVTVVDKTIPVDLGTKLLGRFSQGCPLVEVTTSLRYIDVELGDFISIEDDVFFHHQFTRPTDGTAKWEVVRKEVRIGEDSPAIYFKLALASLTDISIALPVDLQIDMPELTLSGSLGRGETVISTAAEIIEALAGSIVVSGSSTNAPW